MAGKRPPNALVLRSSQGQATFSLESSEEEDIALGIYKTIADLLCVLSLLIGFSCTALYHVYWNQLTLPKVGFIKSVILLFAIGNVTVALVLLLEVAHRSFVVSTEVLYIQILLPEARDTTPGQKSQDPVLTSDVVKAVRHADSMDFWNMLGWIHQPDPDHYLMYSSIIPGLLALFAVVLVWLSLVLYCAAVLLA